MGSPALVRLDALLVKRGLAASRQRAQELIEEGAVLVNGLVAKKSAMRVRTDQPILLKEDYPWVGRGALLLGRWSPWRDVRMMSVRILVRLRADSHKCYCIMGQKKSMRSM